MILNSIIYEITKEGVYLAEIHVTGPGDTATDVYVTSGTHTYGGVWDSESEYWKFTGVPSGVDSGITYTISATGYTSGTVTVTASTTYDITLEALAGIIQITTGRTGLAVGAMDISTWVITTLTETSSGVYEGELEPGTYIVTASRMSDSITVAAGDFITRTWLMGDVNVYGPDSTATNVKVGSYAATWNSDGFWSVAYVPTGTYTVTADGYVSGSVTVSAATTYDITLESAEYEIQVTGPTSSYTPVAINTTTDEKLTGTWDSTNNYWVIDLKNSSAPTGAWSVFANRYQSDHITVTGAGVWELTLLPIYTTNLYSEFLFENDVTDTVGNSTISIGSSSYTTGILPTSSYSLTRTSTAYSIQTKITPVTGASYNYSWSFWFVRPTNTTAYTKTFVYTNRYRNILFYSDSLYYYSTGSSYKLADITDSNPHHVVVSYKSATRVTIYLDGVEIGDYQQSTSSITSFLLLNNSTSKNYNNLGQLDNFRIYSGALDQAAVTTLYREGVDTTI